MRRGLICRALNRFGMHGDMSPAPASMERDIATQTVSRAVRRHYVFDFILMRIS
jgi:hypothetical protein